MPNRPGWRENARGFQAVLKAYQANPAADHRDVARQTGFALRTVLRHRKRILLQQMVPGLAPLRCGRPRKINT